MHTLESNWITDGLIDFEYKKYILLSYLKSVKEEYKKRKLYPVLHDLLFHYKNLISIRDNKELMYENFPKEISKADFKKLKLSYTSIIKDDEFMQELEEIIGFALPRMQEAIREGKELYQLIESSLEITEIGIRPLYPNEGYFFLKPFREKATKVYKYQITIFKGHDENYRGINTQFLESIKKGIGETYESLKLSIIRKYQELPNPATFLIDAKTPCPLEQALLPVSKTMLVKHIARSEQ